MRVTVRRGLYDSLHLQATLPVPQKKLLLTTPGGEIYAARSRPDLRTDHVRPDHSTGGSSLVVDDVAGMGEISATGRNQQTNETSPKKGVWVVLCLAYLLMLGITLYGVLT